MGTFQIVKPLRNLTVLENVMLGAFHTSRIPEATERAREVLAFLQMESVKRTPRPRPPRRHPQAPRNRPRPRHPPSSSSSTRSSPASPPARPSPSPPLLQRLPEWGVSAVAGVEHLMQVVMKIAQRVVVLDHGALIAKGAPAALRSSRPTYLGRKFKDVTG